MSSKGTGSIGLFTNSLSNVQLNVSHTASAVNYLNVTGSATGTRVGISSQGSDTNVGINYIAKGAEGHAFFSNGGSAIQMFVSPTASAVNYAQVTGSATGAAPTFSAQGTDTNIGINLNPKGTGTIHANWNGNYDGILKVYNAGTGASASARLDWSTGTGNSYVIGALKDNTSSPYWQLAAGPAVTGYYFDSPVHYFRNASGAAQFEVSSTGSAVNWIQAKGATTTNDPTLTAVGSDTNIDVQIVPKGTGGLRFSGPLLPNNLAGTAGQVLTSAGAGAVPTWQAAPNKTTTGLWENAATISSNYSITAGNNAVSAGPVTIASGITVTVPSGSTWVVV